MLMSKNTEERNTIYVNSNDHKPTSLNEAATASSTSKVALVNYSSSNVFDVHKTLSRIYHIGNSKT